MPLPSLAFPDELRRAVRAGREHFIVTGAAGWLGRATLEMFDEALGPDLPERIHPFARAARLEKLRSGRSLFLRSLAELEHIPEKPDGYFLIHFAFLTREKVSAAGIDDYVDQNRQLTRLTVAQAARLAVRGTFSTSSGAVYRKDGALEHDLAANPYGFLKLEEEVAFANNAVRVGGRAQICRVFNLAGPFLNKDYAIGSMIADALAGRPIAIRAPHQVYRSFTHVRDVVAVGIAGMMGVVGASNQPYDTAGGETVEMRALAERVREVLRRPELDIVRPPPSGAAWDRYVGDGTAFAAMRRQLGGAPFTLEEQIRDTAEYLSFTSTS
jgi:nucleoside-diphosphate-sugar epimerase